MIIDLENTVGYGRFLAKLAVFSLPLLVAYELTQGNWLGDRRLDQLLIQRNMRQTASKVYCAGCKPIPVTYETDEYGFRGRHNNVSNIDILTVGSSTTVQMDVNAEDTFQAEIKRRLAGARPDLNIVSAGVDGQSTRGYLNDFDRWFAFVPGMKARVVLFYLSIDEIQRPEAMDAYSSEMDALSAPPNSLTARLSKNSASLFLARGLATTWIDRAFNGRGRGEVSLVKPSWTTEARQRDHAALFQAELAAFGQRLRALSERTRAFGALPVFVLPREGSYEFREGRWMGLDDVKSLASFPLTGIDVLMMTREMEKVMKQACSSSGAIGLSVAEAKIFEETDFFDFRHATPSGSRKLGALMAEALRPHLRQAGILPD